jgi:type II secretion system protein J
MFREAPNQHGFTLLEVMIAVVILAAMSLAMYGATSSMLSGKEASETRDEFYHSVTFALEKISDDVHMAFIVKSKDLLGVRFDGEYAFDGKEDRLDFITFSHLRYIRDAKESDSAEVSYFLVPDPENTGSRILMRRESAVIDKNLQEGGVSYPLLHGVRSLRFEYLASDKEDEWKQIWDSQSLDAGNKLPRAVRIQIELTAPDEEEARKVSLTVPIRLSKPLSF